MMVFFNVILKKNFRLVKKR